MFLEIFNLLVAYILTFVGVFTFWKVDGFIDFYKPLVLFLAGYILGIVLFWIISDIYGRIISLKKEYKKVDKFSRFLLTNWMRYTCNHGLVLVKFINKDLMPKNERFLLVQNHASRFDPMIINGYFPTSDIAFITKPSNYKIPLAKRLMPSLFYQAINREDPIQSLEVMKNSINLIENNITSIGVYPEGTRHADGELGEFHEGVFNICLKAKCPLVVVKTTNTQNVSKNFPRHYTRVTLKIIEVVPYEQMANMTAKSLSEHVHELMSKPIEG